MITIDTSTCICILAIVIFLLTTAVVVVSVLLYRALRKLTQQCEESNRLLFLNMRKAHYAKEALDERLEDIQQIRIELQSLSSGLKIQMQREEEKANQKHWPTPELADQITKTIREQITIELFLSRNLQAPARDYLYNITEHVMKTYPDIEPSYLIHKCIAIAESELSRQNSK